MGMIEILLVLATSLLGFVFMSNKKPDGKLILKRRDNFVINSDFESSFLS